MKEGDGVRDERRRRFVKQVALGAGAVAGIGMLPESWSKPMLQVGALPAHAQTSAVYPLFSSPSSLSATNNASDTGNDIYVIFDGAFDLSLVAGAELNPTPPDALIAVDTDPGYPDQWDAYPCGSNWTMVDGGGISFTAGGTNYSGTFTIVVDGPGGRFRLTFTVAVSSTDPPTATVSGVSVQPV